MKAEWVDITSYSRGEKDRVPRTWSLKLPSITITVTRHIHYEKDDWLWCCDDLGVSYRFLLNKDIDGAKTEAVEETYAVFEQMEIDLIAYRESR